LNGAFFALAHFLIRLHRSRSRQQLICDSRYLRQFNVDAAIRDLMLSPAKSDESFVVCAQFEHKGAIRSARGSLLDATGAALLRSATLRWI